MARRDELLELLRPPAHRGPLIAAGAVLFTVGIVLEEFRLENELPLWLHLVITAAAAALIYGIGVDHTAFDEPPADWTPALREADLPEGEARYAEVGGVGVMIARVDGEVHAIANRCSHRGGPLDEGELSDGCVTCPWHGSRFRLADGSVERGPAAYPQPAWETRISAGVIELRGPRHP